MTSLQENVLKWETELLNPNVRGDRNRLASYLAENFTEIAMNGREYSKAEIMKLLEQKSQIEYRITESKVSILSDRIIMHLFGCLVLAGISSDPILTRRCSIWQLYGSKWKMVFHQGTPVTHH